MKEFANKINVKCDMQEARAMQNLLIGIGYRHFGSSASPEYCWLITYNDGTFSFYNHDGAPFAGNRYLVEDVGYNIIRDIVSVCSNETWQKDEPTVYHFRGGFIYSGPDGDNSSCNVRNHPFHFYRRPTVAEICNHYGYHLEGNNIVKNIEKPTLEERVAKLEEVVNSAKPCCETEHWKWFTTDGCKIKTGDMVFYVDDDLKVRSFKFLGANNHTPSKDWTFFKFTSLYEADCEEYVLKNKPFEPIDVVITCNSPEELRGLWHTLNVSQTKAQEKAKNGTYIGDFSIDTYKWWRTVDSVLDNLNLNLDTKK
jgi:hypothetical protein